MNEEEFAEKLHEWYLEACKEINPSEFNKKAQMPYEGLSESQKFIDRYIAEKVIKLFRYCPRCKSKLQYRCLDCNVVGF